MLASTISEKFVEPRPYRTSVQPLETDGVTDQVAEVSKNTSFISTLRSREPKTEDEKNDDIVNKEPALKATVSGYQLVVAVQSRRHNSFSIKRP